MLIILYPFIVSSYMLDLASWLKHSISIETPKLPRWLQSVLVGFLAMGLAASMMGFPSIMGLGLGSGSGMKGMPSSPMLGLVMGTLYSKFLEKEITEFDQFQVVVLDIFNTFNSALPGKHYDVPPRKDVVECYEHWRQAANDKKKEIFIDFMKRNVGLSRLDDSTLMTGLVTPPVAMAAKKAGESVPQLNMIKVVPDVVFVPTITLIALITAKLSRRMFVKNIASSEHES